MKPDGLSFGIGCLYLAHSCHGNKLVVIVFVTIAIIGVTADLLHPK